MIPIIFGTGLTGACDAAYNPTGIASFFASFDQNIYANAGFDPVDCTQQRRRLHEGCRRQQAAEFSAFHAIGRRSNTPCR